MISLHPQQHPLSSRHHSITISDSSGSVLDWLLHRTPYQSWLLGIIIWGITSLTDQSINLDPHLLVVGYIIPILLLTWIAGARSGLLVAVLSAASRIFAIITARPNLNSPLTTTGRFLLLVAVFMVVVWVINALHDIATREHNLACHDGLTGLLNTRALHEGLAEMYETAKRQYTPLTVVYLDCDGFKRVNDRYGHKTGDRVLREIGRTLNCLTCAQTLAARIGGDEFVLVMPNTGGSGATKAVERIRMNLLTTMRQQGWDVTFSIGVADFSSMPESIDQLLDTADQLMYQIKRNGKDGIVYQQFGTEPKREIPAETWEAA